MAQIKWTARYWAVRNGTNWRLTEKIAGPLEAMRKAWGATIEKDVVILIGLVPTPIERLGERFDATYEIVNLGRNRQTARDLVAKLVSQAQDEMRLQRILKENVEQNFIEYLRSTVEAVAAAMKEAGGRLQHRGLSLWLNYDIDQVVTAEVQGQQAQRIIDALDASKREAARDGSLPQDTTQDGKIIRREATATVERLTKLLLSGEVNQNYSDWHRLYNVHELRSLAEFRTQLLYHLNQCDLRDQAIAEMERRAALRRQPVDSALPEVVGEPSKAEVSPASSPS